MPCAEFRLGNVWRNNILYASYWIVTSTVERFQVLGKFFTFHVEIPQYEKWNEDSVLKYWNKTSQLGISGALFNNFHFYFGKLEFWKCSRKLKWQVLHKRCYSNFAGENVVNISVIGTCRIAKIAYEQWINTSSFQKFTTFFFPMIISYKIGISTSILQNFCTFFLLINSYKKIIDIFR